MYKYGWIVLADEKLILSNQPATQTLSRNTTRGIEMKTCSTCKQIKEIYEFYKHPFTKDGYHPVCKICSLKHQKQYSQTEKGKVARYRAVRHYRQTKKGKIANNRANKRYSQSEKGKVIRRKASKRYNLRYPERIKAKNAVDNAVASGKIPRIKTLKCNYCPKQAEQYHHYLGYAPEHWFDVIPTCIKCHKKEHKKVA